MKITIIGAGNSGLAMAAHLSHEGHNVTLWNRTKSRINKLIETRIIKCEGVIQGEIEIGCVTADIKEAVTDKDLILVTTPANSHKELAELIAKNIKHWPLIVLNPGRTFGALEFLEVFKKFNKYVEPTVAETQTIIYTCRKTSEDSVNIIAMKEGVLLSTFNAGDNGRIVLRLPKCIQKYYSPARSMIETSIGNVGMILHCAPLLLNSGWTESENSTYKYYYDGITPTIGSFLEKIDEERVTVSERLGLKIETTKEWFDRTYNVRGESLYDCIQNNDAYKTIDAPNDLNHRYILEDVPCGLVPLESIGKQCGLSMRNTGIIVDLASGLLNIDFRKQGREICKFLHVKHKIDEFIDV